MKPFLFLSFLLCSCVGAVRQDASGNTTVVLPFMAKADRFAVSSDDGKGKKLKVMVVNGNAENVPIAGINAIQAYEGANIAFKGAKVLSDNGVKTTQIKSTPTILTPTETSTGKVLTPKAVFPPQ